MRIPKAAIGGIVAAGLLAVTGLSACGSDTAATTNGNIVKSSHGGHSDASATTHTVSLIDGTTVRVPAAGATNVLFFFGIGCGECVPALRRIEAARRKTHGAHYMGIDMAPTDTRADLRSFRSQLGNVRMPLTVDADGDLATTYNVTALGTTLVLDASGSEVYSAVDPQTSAVAAAVRRADR